MSTPTTTAHAIKCGVCRGTHPTAAEVRACFERATGPIAAPSVMSPAATPSERRIAAATTTPRPTERQIEFANSLRATLGRKALSDPLPSWVTRRVMSEWIDDLKADIYAARQLGEIPAAAPRAQGGSSTSRIMASEFPTVTEGHYAVTSHTGNNDLDFFRVDTPAEGQWAGRLFVKRVIGGRPDQAIRGSEARELLKLAEDAPVEARRRYGVEIGRCSCCNRHLTDETSRELGIGPECRRKGA